MRATRHSPVPPGDAAAVVEELIRPNRFRTWLDLSVVQEVIKAVCPGPYRYYIDAYCRGNIPRWLREAPANLSRHVYVAELIGSEMDIDLNPDPCSFADLFFAATVEEAEEVWKRLEQLERQQAKGKMTEAIRDPQVYITKVLSTPDVVTAIRGLGKECQARTYGEAAPYAMKYPGRSTRDDPPARVCEVYCTPTEGCWGTVFFVADPDEETMVWETLDRLERERAKGDVIS